MNPQMIPVIIGASVCFVLGIWLTRNTHSSFQKLSLVAAASLAAIPAILFSVYYTGIMGEAGWFYSFRSMPGSEFAACGLGFIAGWIQVRRAQSQFWRRQTSGFFIPFILLVCVAVPYLKQIFFRPDWNNFKDRWSENVCLQSSESSCGPASAATVLRQFGKPASEKQIAQKSFTSRRGTENWYLIRTIRQHGLEAHYSIQQPNSLVFSFPAVVGVRLGDKSGTGHFIAILGKSGSNKSCYVIGDPLIGREELTADELLERYYFTGFSISVTTNRY